MRRVDGTWRGVDSRDVEVSLGRSDARGLLEVAEGFEGGGTRSCHTAE